MNNTERCECERKMYPHLLIHLREIHVLTLYFYLDIYIYKYIKHTHKRILYVGCFFLIDFWEGLFLMKIESYNTCYFSGLFLCA